MCTAHSSDSPFMISGHPLEFGGGFLRSLLLQCGNLPHGDAKDQHSTSWAWMETGRGQFEDGSTLGHLICVENIATCLVPRTFPITTPSISLSEQFF